MAKKKKEKKEDFIGTIKDDFKKGLFFEAIQIIKEKIMLEIEIIKKKTIKFMVAIFLVLIGWLFIFNSMAILLERYFYLEHGAGYLIMGIILLFIGFMLVKMEK